jgi:hypothetical protein
MFTPLLSISFFNYRFTCVFTYISIFLTLSYTLLLLRCIIYLYRLFHRHPSNKRRPQKIFLLFTTFTCIGRALYFLLWPATETDVCTPTTDNSDNIPLWLTILGTLPPCLFLSSFSVNVFTFGRIYHTILFLQRNRFQLLLSLLLTCNLAVYSLTILAYFGGSDNRDTAFLASIWCLSICVFLVAIGFSFYGLMLYYRMKYVQHNWTWNSTEYTEIRTGKNPMFKLAVVSIICLCCFLIRAILLPVLVKTILNIYILK